MTDEATRPKSPWWLAFRVFDEPGAVFAELTQRPRVLIPLLLLFVLSPALIAVGTPEAVLRDQMEQQLDIVESRNPDALTPEERAEQLDAAASPARRAIIFGGALAVGFIAIAIVSLILQLIFNAMAADKITFKQELAIVSHAWMPQVAGAVLLILLTRFAGLEQLQLSLGFLVSGDEASFMYQFANQITLFGVWSMLLVAIGNQTLIKAPTLGGALAVVAGMWITVKIALAGLTSFLVGLAS